MGKSYFGILAEGRVVPRQICDGQGRVLFGDRCALLIKAMDSFLRIWKKIGPIVTSRKQNKLLTIIGGDEEGVTASIKRATPPTPPPPWADKRAEKSC